MIKAVKLADKNVVFGAKPEKKDNGEVESRILPNTLRKIPENNKCIFAVSCKRL